MENAPMLRTGLLVAVLALLVALLFAGPLKSNRTGADAFAASPPPADDETSFRILLGLTDTKSTPWNGSLSVSRGSVTRLEPWRFDEDDVLSGESAWQLSTHPMRVFGGQAPRPIVVNGVVATFRNLTVDSDVRVETVQGMFSFRPADLPFGTVARFLDERVAVDRVPASTQIASSREERDYPAAATDRQGNLWVAYLQFTPNPKFVGIRMAVKQPITSYVDLAEPSRGDLYKPAVAVDGSGRVWVFWSANTGGNFDLYARAFQANTSGKELRLTSDPGPDVNPVATTDAEGRV